jgi:glycosyltransferase involved in cell wall biosynthesis
VGENHLRGRRDVPFSARGMFPREDQPLVSICMPVFNGERWLAEALDCLVNQTYRTLEILVLDNRSTDRTAAIVQRKAERDSRIRYMLDDRQRDPQAASTRLVAMASGRYCMIACDDDHWHPEFISTLVTELQGDPRLGMAFCNYDWIDEEGRSLVSVSIRPRPFRAEDSCLRNLLVYLEFRNPLLTFGIFRTKWLQAILPFTYPDPDCWWNADNLYLLKFLARHRIVTVEQRLFSYRRKDRTKYIPTKWRGRALRLEFFRARHQWRVFKAFWGGVSESPLPLLQRLVLLAYLPINLFNNLFTWRLYHLVRSVLCGAPI